MMNVALKPLYGCCNIGEITLQDIVKSTIFKPTQMQQGELCAKCSGCTLPGSCVGYKNIDKSLNEY